MKGFSIRFNSDSDKTYMRGYLDALGFESPAKVFFHYRKNGTLTVETGSIEVNQDGPNESNGLVPEDWKAYAKRYIAWHKVDFSDSVSADLKELYFKIRSALELGIEVEFGLGVVKYISLNEGVPFLGLDGGVNLGPIKCIDRITIKAKRETIAHIDRYDPEGYTWDAPQKAYILEPKPEEESEPAIGYIELLRQVKTGLDELLTIVNSRKD